MAYSVRAGDGDNLGTELGSLLHSAPSHVTEAGDADLLAGDVLASLVEKVLGEIEGSKPVASGRRMDPPQVAPFPVRTPV